jgi:hypothetical protein
MMSQPPDGIELGKATIGFTPFNCQACESRSANTNLAHDRANGLFSPSSSSASEGRNAVSLSPEVLVYMAEEKNLEELLSEARELRRISEELMNASEKLMQKYEQLRWQTDKNEADDS